MWPGSCGQPLTHLQVLLRGMTECLVHNNNNSKITTTHICISLCSSGSAFIALLRFDPMQSHDKGMIIILLLQARSLCPGSWLPSYSDAKCQHSATPPYSSINLCWIDLMLLGWPPRYGWGYKNKEQGWVVLCCSFCCCSCIHYILIHLFSFNRQVQRPATVQCQAPVKRRACTWTCPQVACCVTRETHK